ncbi:tyrosine-type recombinase/integrase [Neobacillus ginsengisoli]|uniref:Site-specific recombinase XerD n=1 Tax=Neobacillus ginsengisoli TaxID=904295 RepID=A0ABT9Y4C2_9BACI|nr:phage integrase N-terminal SAM-like domain-containing protein [Neobacillus ginsengisoli]MDQ0201974.1 site-specific recombinase XerD [Neobacillus ginsengisoli]
MPYRFIRHIENKGYSSETLKSYEKVINQFFKFIAKSYPLNKEPFQISPTDIKNYLEEQLELDKSISTVNKELAIIKTFFNYLWEINKVPIDPAVKIKRFKVKKELKVVITYDVILSILEKVLSNQDYSKLRKTVFLLAVKGLKTADFRFKKEDVLDSIEDNSMIIQLKSRSISLRGKEAACFCDYYSETIMYSESEYVFTATSHGEQCEVPIHVMSILNHLRAITSDYLGEGSPGLTLISIRRAMALNLYLKKYSIQVIAKELGIEENTASNYLKHIIQGNIGSES